MRMKLKIFDRFRKKKAGEPILVGGIVIFKGDKIMCDWYDRPRESTELAPGDYMLVGYGVGDVGGGSLGVKSLFVRNLHTTRATKITSMTRNSDLFAMAGEETVLSPAQRKMVVLCIKREYVYWWDHAPPTIKALLGEEVTIEDRARHMLIEGRSLYYANRLSEAAKLVEQALTLDPKLREARSTLGRIALYQGDVQTAITHFQEELACARDPDEYNAHAYLSVIYDTQGRVGEAQLHARSAMAYGMFLSPEEVKKIRAAVRAAPTG
jgi:tetratricopeptide (TPR) repeat protein